MSEGLKTIFLIPEKIDEIHMSDQLFSELQLKEGQELPILLGKKTISALVQRSSTVAANEIIIPEKLLKQFSLPVSSYKFQVRLLPNETTLQFGPIVGLVTDFHINEQNEPDFRSVHTFCKELHQVIANAGGFFYVFSPKEFEQRGFYFHDGKWKSFLPPLPDVIYNRIHSRKLEYSRDFKHFRRLLSQLTIPIFNDGFLSKWEVYEKLHHDPFLQLYLPETTLFSIENLHDFFKKYETVFIKPIHGSLGRNILKISKTNTNVYVVQSSVRAGTENYMSIDEITPSLGNRITIIQQAIPFIKHNGCTVDFRVLCHKSTQLDWEVTSIVARAAGEEEIVSNLARGGKVLKPMAVLTAFTNQQRASEILSLIMELAITICSCIGRTSRGITGELGIDIGIDLDGKPWLIEVNSKPSKTFEDGLLKIRPSAKAIIAFCRLLTFTD